MWRRLPRLLAGLVLFGVAIACMVRADLGLPPWDVLHQGVAERTGLAIGTASIIVGVVVLLLWIPLRERVGIGTVANALIVGLVIDATMAVVETPASTAAASASSSSASCSSGRARASTSVPASAPAPGTAS